ncbi:MAG: GNAT family N-acetyltransferase [Chloroflexi bacterium]|nr:GNAT family N-acetyltransferase [Chloroflexota bacterium]
MNLYTYDQRPDLIKQVRAFIPKSWPEFMLHDPIAGRLWDRMEGAFPQFQFVLCEDGDRVVAMGNSVPFVWDGTPESLPERGWDAVFEQCLHDHDEGRTPNALSALQAVVAPGNQGKGLSRHLLQGMRQIALRHGLSHFVAPVRPTLKSTYPLTPMERYVTWAQPDGAPFDPWMRTHWRLGAHIVRVAPQSMTISGPVADWEAWTGMHFPESGRYIVPGALNPVEIDCERDEGRYVEPNVWMRHKE